VPNDSEAPFTLILLDVRENFVGAFSAELWADCQIGRVVPDRTDLGMEFRVGLLFLLGHWWTVPFERSRLCWELSRLYEHYKR